MLLQRLGEFVYLLVLQMMLSELLGEYLCQLSPTHCKFKDRLLETPPLVLEPKSETQRALFCPEDMPGILLGVCLLFFRIHIEELASCCTEVCNSFALSLSEG